MSNPGPGTAGGATPFERFALWCGVASPLLYFGDQLVASLFYPGYSFVHQSASELGSDLAPHPAIFNGGALAIGLVTLVACWGFKQGLERLGVHRLLVWATVVLVFASALMDIWAGVFSMPDPRHGQNPFQIGAMAAPAVIAAAIWTTTGWGVRAYFIASVLLFLAMLANLVPIDRGLYGGLFQRLLAIAVFPPVGVGAWVIRARLDAARRGEPEPACADRSTATVLAAAGTVGLRAWLGEHHTDRVPRSSAPRSGWAYVSRPAITARP